MCRVSQFPIQASRFNNLIEQLMKQIDKITTNNIISLKLLKQIKLWKCFAVSLFNVYFLKCTINILFVMYCLGGLFSTQNHSLQSNIYRINLYGETFGYFSLYGLWCVQLNLSFCGFYQVYLIVITNIYYSKKYRRHTCHWYTLGKIREKKCKSANILKDLYFRCCWCFSSEKKIFIAHPVFKEFESINVMDQYVCRWIEVSRNLKIYVLSATDCYDWLQSTSHGIWGCLWPHQLAMSSLDFIGMP